MAAQTTNYQCPACTGPMHYDAASGRLKCDYCDSSYTVEEIEKLYSGKNTAAAAAMQKEESSKAETAEAGAWDSSSVSDWGADAEQLRAYNCSSCGAELICDSTTAATECPYCGNPTVIPGKLSGSMKPEYVLPFRLDKKAAVAALERHYKGKKLLPRSFSSANRIEKIQGVYVPFWLYNGSAQADMQFNGERIMTRRQGDYQITETFVYNIHRGGMVDFKDIPVDGSSKMNDELMDSIEPYDYSDLKPFSLSYLPGFLADRYDVSMEECARRADERAANSAAEAMLESVHGFSGVRETHRSIRLLRGRAHYVLMPVWLLTTRYEDKAYTFAMNGQTGKFVGDLPMDKALWRKWLLIYGGTVSAVLFVLANLLLRV